jgi:serine/threonine protein kinase
MSTVLAIVNHNTMQPSAPVGAETKIDDTWELDPNSVRVNLNQFGDPMEPLGQGSFGVVGLGTLTRDGIVMPVAVKMAMANKRAAATRQPAGKNIVDDFGREVRLLATMEHPNIVQCFGSITHKDGVCVMWIVMEKLDFTLLAAIKGKHLKIGRDDPQTYADLVAGICSALAYLHSPVAGKPIVHRDLKPENIMIKSLEERVVKLIDFDMAKETQTGVGSTMSTKGTREYMSPEVHKNGGCSVASDMWALALVALFIFSGKTPTESSDIRKIEESPHPKANFTQELMSRCLNERPEYRPAASMVSFSLEGYEEKRAATAGIENTFYWNICFPVARFVRQVTYFLF